MLAPDPVEAFLRHTQRNDDVDEVAIRSSIGRFQGCGDAVALGGIVVDEVGHLNHVPGSRLDQVEPCLGIDALPITEVVHDVLGLAMLVFQALARIDRWDVDDGLHRRIEQRRNLLGVRPGVKAVADIERLQILVAIELLVVGVGDGLELGFVFRRKHWDRITPEIAARHRHDMRLVASDQLRKLRAETVARIGGDVVEFVDSYQAVVECFRAKLVECEAERRMSADEHLFVARKEFADRLDLRLRDLGVIGSRRVAQVPLRGDVPVSEETGLAQWFAVKACADRAFGHADDGLADILVRQLVERYEHERARLARGRWRFDQQILLAALLIGLCLHRAHAQLVRLGRRAGLGSRERYGGNDLILGAHLKSSLCVPARVKNMPPPGPGMSSTR